MNTEYFVKLTTQASTSVPFITAEVTNTIEDVIKQRIKSEAWDDVIRKIPDENVAEQNLPEISQEKSKAGLSQSWLLYCRLCCNQAVLSFRQIIFYGTGLGELYEAEFLKRSLGIKDDDQEKKKTETRQLFKTLCDKLNALSNFHFTPKRASAELEVNFTEKSVKITVKKENIYETKIV